MSDAAPAAAPRTLTAADVAALTGGTLVGDPHAVVSGLAPLATASSSELSFCGDARYVAALASSRAGVLLLPTQFREAPAAASARVIVVDAFAAMLPMLSHFRPQPQLVPGIHPTVTLGHGVTLGADVSIGANVVIGAGTTIGDRTWIDANVVIGDGCRLGTQVRLHPHVTLYPHTRLGDRVEIHAGSRLGADGFGYKFDGTAHRKVPHVGHVVIEQDVEIGANCTVDRGTLDDTVIGAGTKLDDMVHVGHNVRVGRLCLLMAQVGIAGSAVIGDGCVLAGQSGVGGHVSMGAGAKVGAQAGVIRDMPGGETWSGFPARDHREMLRGYAALTRLTRIVKEIEALVEKERV